MALFCESVWAHGACSQTGPCSPQLDTWCVLQTPWNMQNTTLHCEYGSVLPRKAKVQDRKRVDIICTVTCNIHKTCSTHQPGAAAVSAPQVLDLQQEILWMPMQSRNLHLQEAGQHERDDGAALVLVVANKHSTAGRLPHQQGRSMLQWRMALLLPTLRQQAAHCLPHACLHMSAGQASGEVSTRMPSSTK